jgi:dethiobiotin synthetase
LLRRVAGSADSLSDISPYRFGPPLAPLVAARRQRTRISLATIVQRFQRLASRHDIVVVEGVGGLMVPLSETKTTLDLAQAIGLPLLLVIGNRLGAINHALLTVEVAKSRGLQFSGGIVNQTGRLQDDAVRTNPRVLQELLTLPCWGVVPHVTGKKAAWETTGRHLERAGLLEVLLKRTTR